MDDAGVFPWMEREVKDRGARTLPEIRAAVHAVWDALDEAMLGKIAARVRRNMKHSIAINGGNFYKEGAVVRAPRG